MRSTRPQILLVTCAAGALAACGSASATGPSRPVALDATVAQLTTFDLAATAVENPGVPPTYLLGAAADSLLALVPATCTYSAPTGGFACPARTVNALTVTGSYYLRDAGGAALARRDSARVSSIRAVVDVQGTRPIALDGASYTTTLTRHTDMTMSGLLTGTPTVNGTTTAHYDVTLPSDSLHLVADLVATTQDLVRPASHTAGGFPKGTITVEASTRWTERARPPQQIAGRVTMAYDGRGTEIITITSGTQTTLCQVDLTGTLHEQCTHP